MQSDGLHATCASWGYAALLAFRYSRELDLPMCKKAVVSGRIPSSRDAVQNHSNRRAASPVIRPRIVVVEEIDTLMREATRFGAMGAKARSGGRESEAEEHFRNAFCQAMTAAERGTKSGVNFPRQEILRTAAILALEFGDVAVARRLVREGFDSEPSPEERELWEKLRDETAWPDGWLVAAVRREPPDDAALAALVERHWNPLFGLCQMLVLNREKAQDMAQETWRRMLRARHNLKPGGNFSAYLSTIARNIWRDSNRSAQRAGAMAEHRLASLDAGATTEDGDTVELIDMLPDLNALQAHEQKSLALEIDQALEKLSPLLRDVIVSRLLMNESCAEIGERYGRTEQTVSGWVREGIRQMKTQLEELGSVNLTDRKNENPNRH